MVQRLIFLVILGAMFSSCSKYYRFDELYDKGDFVKAYSILEEVKNKENPHYQKRLYRIVTRLALDGDTDFIQKLKVIATNEHSKEVEHYSDFALTYAMFLEAKNPRQYAVILTNLADIRSVPEEFVVYGYKIRGISHYKTGNYKEAISDLQESFKLLPHVDNLYFIGMSYYGLENYEQADHYFNRVLNGTLNNFFKSLAYFQLGEMSYYKGKYSDALEKYVNAANQYSGSADYTYKIAKCLQKLHYNRLSPKFLKVSLRIQKDYANAWFFLNIN